MGWNSIKDGLCILPRAGLGMILSASLVGWQVAPNDPKPAPKKFLLIPVDDRPATGQFAMLMGKIADVEVETPPQETLGRFTTPGAPEKVLAWLEGKDLSAYDGIIVSTDMVCYGGLIASRTYQTSLNDAKTYLSRFEALRKKAPGVPFYGFSATMRLSPTSTTKSASYRELLTKTVLRRIKFVTNPSFATYFDFVSTAIRNPGDVLRDYDFTRARNHSMQLEWITSLQRGVFDYLIIGEDDSKPDGPQPIEESDLEATADVLGIRSRTYFCEGIDQHANVLLSRAILDNIHYSPIIRVVYSDPDGTNIIPPYESQPIGKSTVEQIVASGAQLAWNPDTYDYSLFINTPNPRPASFNRFLEDLGTELEQNFPVSVADIDLGKSGTGNETLFKALNEGDRATKLMSYSGWNTAGNTLGTSIPSANIYLAARRIKSIDPLQRELNQRAFLIHRLINDFEYHRYTRPQAYAMIDSLPGVTRDEAYGPSFDRVNDFVRTDLEGRLNDLFKREFEGTHFYAGSHRYEMTALRDVNVELPWPRVFEVRIGFSIQAKEVPLFGQ